MNRDDANITLLARAVELTDRDGALLPLAVRDRCTAAAGPPEPDAATARADDVLTDAEQAFIVRRADRVRTELGSRSPGLAALADLGGVSAPLAGLLPVVALAAGVVASHGWSGDRLNLLGLPLYGLLAWNFAVYVLLVIRTARPASPARPQGFIRALLGMQLARLQARVARAATGHVAGDANPGLATQVAARFLRDWAALERPALLPRAGALLHAGAAAFAAGVALGLFLFGMVGLLGELEVGWRTNFPSWMTPARVHALLSLVFAPAAALTGRTIPAVGEIEAMRFDAGHGGGEAEGWLVLTIASLVLYVVVPRLALWGLSAAQAGRLHHRFLAPRWSDPYYRALLQATRGAGQVAGVTWHQVEMGGDLQSRTRAALRAALGGRTRLDFAGPVRFGEEADAAGIFAGRDHRERLAVVFSIADTPEDEVQGELIRQLSACGPPGEEGPPLVVLDPAPYRRFRDDPAFRGHYDERLQAWRQFVADHGAALLLLDPAPGEPAEGPA